MPGILLVVSCQDFNERPYFMLYYNKVPVGFSLPGWSTKLEDEGLVSGWISFSIQRVPEERGL